MAIQWFPGHMNATKKAITERVRAGIDVVIEMLDARLPGSSCNPLLAELTHGKPALKLLNKQDLADPERTARWLAHFNALPDTRALAFDASEVAPAQRLIEASRTLAPLRGGMTKPMRVLICGIPNVGKSTLVNTLAGRRIAKTGDEAGITKLEQKIALANDFDLFDTPGMMWPRIVVPESGYLLAASGAIGRNAFDEEEVALEFIGRLRQARPGQLEERYKLPEAAALTDDELLTKIAVKRAAALPGGRANLQKAAEIVMHEFRQGLLGRVTLETPEEFAAWRAAGAVVEAERHERRKKPVREAE